jgi:hypothetical protein
MKELAPMREERYANPEQLVPCDGCAAMIRKNRRWCDRCTHVAADIKAVEKILATYKLPPDTRLDQVAAAIREQLREGVGNARSVAAARSQASAQREDMARRRDWWELLQDLSPLAGGRAHGAEELLFGDFPEHSQAGPRWHLLGDFARTTYKDDEADPHVLLAAARAYLEACYAEQGFIGADSPKRDAFEWPTMGETRPGSQERR